MKYNDLQVSANKNKKRVGRGSVPGIIEEWLVG